MQAIASTAGSYSTPKDSNTRCPQISGAGGEMT